MSGEKFYFSKDDGETFEKVTAHELGHQLLTCKGGEYDVLLNFMLVHKRPNNPWLQEDEFRTENWLDWTEAYTEDGYQEHLDPIVKNINDPEKAKRFLVEMVGSYFADMESFEMLDSHRAIPKEWKAYSEEDWSEYLSEKQHD